MRRKKDYLNKKNMLVIIGILLLFIIIYAVRMFMNSQQSVQDSEQPSENQTTPNPNEKTQEEFVNELILMDTMELATTAYLEDKYSGITNINTQFEYMGKGYGIVNATYEIGGQSINRKVYLRSTENQWTGFHDSDGVIDCDTVTNVLGSDAVLSSMCE